MNPGIYSDLDLAAYHATGAVGKSTLWTLHSKTPAHTRTESEEPTADMEFGTACHSAILEPHRFDKAVICGPADRRGKKWAEALEANPGALVLPAPAFEKVLRLRDTVMRDQIVRQLPSEFAMIEHSAFWVDEETQLLCKCRPDLYRGDQNMIVDLKTTGDATKQVWLSRAMNMGYHVQDAHYSEGWQYHGGIVDTFLFLVVERDPPFAHAIYELGNAEKGLGKRIARKALQRYAECARADEWPGHDEGVQIMNFPEGVFVRESFEGIYQ